MSSEGPFGGFNTQMHTVGMSEASIVAAAQTGDRQALDDVVRAAMPIVYTLARRALLDDSVVDDVVQDVLVRAVRELPSLRSPDSFRSWLVAIALRQIGTQQERDRTAAGRAAPLDDLTADQIAAGNVEDVALTRLELTRQRRQVVRASQWMEDDDRTLLSLWWLETAGVLSRIELADALGVSVAHAGVRVQRMREQLAIGRAVVEALDRRPRCPDLEGVARGWDGDPGSIWRKRFARHVRSCPVCGAQEAGRVATERLLIPFALLPVPVALAAGLLVKTAAAGTAANAVVVAGAVGAGAKTGFLGQLTSLAATHPVAVAMTTAVLVTGTAVSAVQLPPDTSGTPVIIAAPDPSPVTTPAKTAPAVAPTTTSRRATTTTTSRRTTTTTEASPVALMAAGPLTLESTDQPGQVWTVIENLTFLRTATEADEAGRQAATVEAVPGLADPACYSFRTGDGRYLRHSSWRLRAMEKTAIDTLFDGDATFCVRTGDVKGSIALESQNYPGWFVHRRGDEVWVDHSDGSDVFLAESSFRRRAPLAG